METSSPPPILPSPSSLSYRVEDGVVIQEERPSLSPPKSISTTTKSSNNNTTTAASNKSTRSSNPTTTTTTDNTAADIVHIVVNSSSVTRTTTTSDNNAKVIEKKKSFFHKWNKSKQQSKEINQKQQQVKHLNKNTIDNTTDDEDKNNHHHPMLDLPSPNDIHENKMNTTIEEEEECKLDRYGVCKNPGMISGCKHSLYAHPLSVKELKEYFDFQLDDAATDVAAATTTTDATTAKDVNFTTDQTYLAEQQQQQEEEENEKKLWKEGGLIWYSTIVPNDYDKNYKMKGTIKMIPKKYYDAEHQSIKSRRPNLAIKNDDFFQSLVKIAVKPKAGDDSLHDDDVSDDACTDDESDFKIFDSDFKIFDNNYDSNHDPNNTSQEQLNQTTQYSKWIFSGVLNGFPGLKHLELVKIEFKAAMVPRWRTHWHTDQNPKDVKPSYPQNIIGLTEVRAKLREPGWSAQGWSKDSPGYVLYYQPPETKKVPRILYGTNIIKTLEAERCEQTDYLGLRYHYRQSPKCIKVHMISHRYAMVNEKWKDKISYHSFALLEWDHGKHCTVIELAFLNGLAGYNGRCNHASDRDEPVTRLFKCFPPEMVKPWKDTLSEIRCIDVPAKNVSEYLEFMAGHTGRDKRFMDVRLTFSHAVRLTFCTQEHIVQYLINYIRRGKTYSEIRKNCQTFAADFCAFLAGKKDVQPFHALNRLEYRNQTHYFLYESTMYEQH